MPDPHDCGHHEGHLSVRPHVGVFVRVSTRDPGAILRFDPAYRYLGGQKFVLYGVADTEQHFFIETTAEDRLKSVYWVQYEAYLPVPLIWFHVKSDVLGKPSRR